MKKFSLSFIKEAFAPAFTLEKVICRLISSWLTYSFIMTFGRVNFFELSFLKDIIDTAIIMPNTFSRILQLDSIISFDSADISHVKSFFGFSNELVEGYYHYLQLFITVFHDHTALSINHYYCVNGNHLVFRHRCAHGRRHG